MIRYGSCKRQTNVSSDQRVYAVIHTYALNAPFPGMFCLVFIYAHILAETKLTEA
jgi:hypothetical protein